jgi:Holliday junction DNA helicase RuvA
MIGRLRGVLAANRDGSITIDVHGVGYEVAMTPRDIGSLPGLGEEIVVHIHTHVREDEIRLYGFGAESDREMYRILLTASGVGPKLAMAMLGSLATDEIIRAVTNEDPDALTIAPGVGKRGAQKIVIELGPKLTGRNVDLTSGGGLGSVRQALEGLGYSTGEINAVVGEIDSNATLEIQIKTALQRLGGR